MLSFPLLEFFLFLFYFRVTDTFGGLFSLDDARIPA